MPPSSASCSSPRPRAKARGFADNGYRCVMTCDKDGGQTVSQIHLRLLADRQTKGFVQ